MDHEMVEGSRHFLGMNYHIHDLMVVASTYWQGAWDMSWTKVHPEVGNPTNADKKPLDPFLLGALCYNISDNRGKTFYGETTVCPDKCQ